MHRQLSEDAAGASRQLLQTATQPLREASSNATALEMLSDSDRSPACVPPTLEGWTRDFQSRAWRADSLLPDRVARPRMLRSEYSSSRGALVNSIPRAADRRMILRRGAAEALRP